MFQGCIRPTDDKNWATCTNQLSPGVSVAQVLKPDRLTDIPLRIFNVNSEPVSLKAGDVITELTAVEECDTNRDTNETKMGATQLEAIDKIFANMDETVLEAERNKLRYLLREFSTVFAFEENKIDCTTAARHEIDTGDARPVRQRMRRQPPAYQGIIKDHVESMLKQGIIAAAQSPWVANIVLVKKKDNTYRCCVDYRSLNQFSRKDAYALPRTVVCLDAIAGAAWFNTLDMKCSYHQVEIEPADADKTAFT